MSVDIQQFQHELAAMRSAVEGYSHAYPAVASELRLSAGHSADPHVEQLLQSFAWLTASLRQDMQQQRHEIPNHLLMSLYPNLLRSRPCMSVMQANVLADGANFVNGYTLAKGRLFQSETDDGGNKPVKCQMQCCYNTPLWPFNINDVSIKPKNNFSFLDSHENVKSVISVKVSSDGADPIYEYPLERLRFFISEPSLRPLLQQLLNESFVGCAIRCGDQVIELNSASLHWLGFDQEENVLPQTAGSHSAYRLLQEYFLFSEKFYFFELSGLDLSSASDSFELLILLDSTIPELALNKHSLAINSFPVINLFPATFKPIQLDHTRYEYRILADESQYGQSEVHSVTAVRLFASDGGIKIAQPWLGNENQGQKSADQLSYLTRLVVPLAPATPGCDTVIALQDGLLLPATPIDQTMSIKGLCNNRSLPESLRIGNTMKLVGAGALLQANIITKPTLFKGAKLGGESTVQLLSQLHLNHVSLLDTAAIDNQSSHSLEKLKQILRLYSDPMARSQQRQIEGIVDMHSKPSIRRMGKQAWRGHYRGTCLTLIIDERFFNGANPFLLSEVLSHFFGLYTTLNHFVQLQLVSSQREGVWKQWHPRIGEQVII